jgi:NAD(P)-dependent dehydrogenase (short-subunit alcohol dehydrogenase family)
LEVREVITYARQAPRTGTPMLDRLLEGRRIVVTGAGMGLGAAYAAALAQAGASVLVNDLRDDLGAATVERIIGAGGNAVAHAADVSDWHAAGTTVAACIDAFGGIDGLVNNAGILGRLRPIYAEEADNARIIEVNVLGTMYPTAHATRAMVAAGSRGSIVNACSGNQCGHELVSTYGASKGAVASYTYAWARELAPYGIRVNAISPNADTAQHDQIVEQLGYDPEAHLPVEPPLEDNAALVTYLLSDRSAELNGQVVRVSPGLVSIMSHPAVVAPGAELAEWTVDSLASAFENGLAGCLQPPGIATADVKILEIVY